ncbi:hypothetical protein DEU40_10411 [Chryseobacterium sp. AG844]|nr:hypothetical protein DEU40_10411 [Chryseobacterium sp. AG844]
MPSIRQNLFRLCYTKSKINFTLLLQNIYAKDYLTMK